jgi:hypothetical protein
VPSVRFVCNGRECHQVKAAHRVDVLIPFRRSFLAIATFCEDAIQKNQGWEHLPQAKCFLFKPRQLSGLQITSRGVSCCNSGLEPLDLYNGSRQHLIHRGELGLGMRGIVGVIFCGFAIERRRIDNIERLPIGEPSREVGIGDEGLAKGDKIRESCINKARAPGRGT